MSPTTRNILISVLVLGLVACLCGTALAIGGAVTTLFKNPLAGQAAPQQQPSLPPDASGLPRVSPPAHPSVSQPANPTPAAGTPSAQLQSLIAGTLPATALEAGSPISSDIAHDMEVIQQQVSQLRELQPGHPSHRFCGDPIRKG